MASSQGGPPAPPAPRVLQWPRVETDEFVLSRSDVVSVTGLGGQIYATALVSLAWAWASDNADSHARRNKESVRAPSIEFTALGAAGIDILTAFPLPSECADPVLEEALFHVHLPSRSQRLQLLMECSGAVLTAGQVAQHVKTFGNARVLSWAGLDIPGRGREPVQPAVEPDVLLCPRNEDLPSRLPDGPSQCVWRTPLVHVHLDLLEHPTDSMVDFGTPPPAVDCKVPATGSASADHDEVSVEGVVGHVLLFYELLRLRQAVDSTAPAYDASMTGEERHERMVVCAFNCFLLCQIEEGAIRYEQRHPQAPSPPDPDSTLTDELDARRLDHFRTFSESVLRHSTSLGDPHSFFAWLDRKFGSHQSRAQLASQAVYRLALYWPSLDSGTLQDRLVQEAATPSEAARQEGERVARLAYVTRKFASSFERIHQLAHLPDGPVPRQYVPQPRQRPTSRGGGGPGERPSSSSGSVYRGGGRGGGHGGGHGHRREPY